MNTYFRSLHTMRKSKRKLSLHSCFPRRCTNPRLPEYETGLLPTQMHIKVVQMEPARGDAAVAAAVKGFFFVFLFFGGD